MNIILIIIIVAALIIALFVLKKIVKISIFMLKISGLLIVTGIIWVILIKIFPDSSLAEITANIIKIIK